jgi:hypothetical protein
MIGYTGEYMGIQNSVIREAGGKGSRRFKEVVKRYQRLNISIHVDASMLQQYA